MEYAQMVCTWSKQIAILAQEAAAASTIKMEGKMTLKVIKGDTEGKKTTC